MCKETITSSSDSQPSNPNVIFCDAFRFVEAHAKEHGEKLPDYKHCANYDPKKTGFMAEGKENLKGFWLEKVSGLFK